MTSQTPAPIPLWSGLAAARLVAAAIDAILILVGFIVLARLLNNDPFVDRTALTVFVAVIGAFAYFFFCELFTGQTLGKKTMRLRVVADSGRLTPGQVAARTLLRIVDMFFFGVVGLTAVLVSKGERRIGGIVAKTRVTRA